MCYESGKKPSDFREDLDQGVASEIVFSIAIFFNIFVDFSENSIWILMKKVKTY